MKKYAVILNGSTVFRIEADKVRRNYDGNLLFFKNEHQIAEFTSEYSFYEIEDKKENERVSSIDNNGNLKLNKGICEDYLGLFPPMRIYYTR